MADSPELVGFTVKELFLEIRNELRSVSGQVNEILASGTQHTRQALEELGALRSRVNDLEVKSATKDAVDTTSSRVTKLIVVTGVAWLLSIADIAVKIWFHK